MGKGSRGRIKSTSLTIDKTSFSFLYLTPGPDNKFYYKGKSNTYFCKVIERLKGLCAWKPTELKVSRSSSLRCNPIEWKKSNVTESCFGLPNEEDLVGEEAYEFGVSGNEHGRIHGFFSDTVFHIVWLDPDHKLIKRPM